jgi:hypothetical protein
MQRETTMRGIGRSGTAVARPPDQDEHAVLEVLEPDQLVAAKQQRLGRQRLGLGARMLMWGLRGYALLMLVVVADRVVQAVNGG